MNTTQAISELQKFLSFKRASEHAEDVLKKLQDAEAGTKEQESKRDKLKEEIAKLDAEATKTKAKIAATDKDVLSIKEAAESTAKAILADAQSQANQILAKAVFDADKERQEAHRLKEENKSLADKNLTLKTEHDSLQAGIEAMKAQAKAFAGA